MNDIRKYINLIESDDDIILGELPEYNTLVKQLKAVRYNPKDIQYMVNPSEQVQLTAVRQDGFVIKYIPNPSEEVQLVSVQKNGLAIKFILAKGIVPSIAVQRAAVLQNPFWALYYMIDHKLPISKMIQWTAAKRIKELGWKVSKDLSDKLDPDVQDYLRSNNQ